MVGFRLGAKFIFDTFVSDDTPYDDFLKKESELEIQNITCIYRPMDGARLSTA